MLDSLQIGTNSIVLCFAISELGLLMFGQRSMMAVNFPSLYFPASFHHMTPKATTSSPAPIPPSILALSRKRSAFTLIELLVVIAIIAVLAGLAFPAVQGALESGKKAQARNDVHQLATAVKSYLSEYGRQPGTGTADGPAPANLIITLTSSNTNNPRGIIFFEPKIARAPGKPGLDGTVYRDPWGNPYTFTLDYNYDNKITANSQTNFTTVIVTSTGGSTNTNSIISNIR